MDTPIGKITLIANDKAVTGLYFGEQAKKTDEDSTVLKLCEDELTAYFNGKLKKFTVPVYLSGTAFRLKVWDELKNIPYGETVSYRHIAEKIGNPKAVRAVGGANHNNPVSIIIPCHRVVGADGSLTGYGGGLDAKKYLLEMEARFKQA